MAAKRKQKKKNKKVIRYKKPLNINIGTIIFLFIFVYLVIVVGLYLSKEKINIYEVQSGNLATSSYYTGLILRDETLYPADAAGYINYYVREGDKAGVGDLVFSVDESGKTTELLADSTEDNNNLSEENLASLKQRLVNFSNSYSPMEFQNVYDMKYELQSMLWEYVSFSALEDIMQNLQDSGAYFKMNYAPASGIVVYATDGFEEITPDAVNAGSFLTKNYQKKYLTAGTLVEAASPAYKTIDSENWSVVIPIREEDRTAFANSNYVDVHFPQKDRKLTGKYSTFVGTDGETYARLDFSKYMIQFFDERYTELELLKDTTLGLKIPKSSVIAKDFYVVPKDFLTTGSDGVGNIFMKETLGENGTTIVPVDPDIYASDEENYYIDTGSFSMGDFIIAPDSQKRYQIGPTMPLTGVYSVNKGYTVFKKVVILEENEEYYIVEKGSSFGISAYDHIVLDGEKVTENQIIY